MRSRGRKISVGQGLLRILVAAVLLGLVVGVTAGLCELKPVQAVFWGLAMTMAAVIGIGWSVIRRTFSGHDDDLGMIWIFLAAAFAMTSSIVMVFRVEELLQQPTSSVPRTTQAVYIMVATFFSAISVQAAPFVDDADDVSAGAVLGWSGIAAVAVVDLLVFSGTMSRFPSSIVAVLIGAGVWLLVALLLFRLLRFAF